MKKIIAVLTACIVMALSVTTAFAATGSPEQQATLIVTRDSSTTLALETAKASLAKGLASVVTDLADANSYTVVDVFDAHTSDGPAVSNSFTFTVQTTIKAGADYKVIHSTDGGNTFHVEKNVSLDANGVLTITVSSLSPFAVLVKNGSSSGSSSSTSSTTSPQTGETTSMSLILLCAGLAGLGCVFAAKSRKRA